MNIDPDVELPEGTEPDKALGDAIAAEISRLNSAYAASHGKDLFKSTNKTVPALTNLAKPIKDLATYKALISVISYSERALDSGWVKRCLPHLAT